MTVTPLPTNTTPTPSAFTNVMWAELVLTFLQAPVTQNNVDTVTTWMTAENSSSTWTGTAGANNPLNNGLGSGGGSGLGTYPDLITSAAYAAKGLEGGITGAAPAGAVLQANGSFTQFQTAIEQSKWASSHYANSGFASLTAAAPPPTVSAAQSASNGASSGVAVASSNTQAIVSQLGLLNDPQGVLASIASLPSDATQLPQQAATDVGDVTGIAGLEQSTAALLGTVTSVAFWERLGMGALGVVLFGIGLAGFISTTKPGQQARSTDAGPALKDAAAAAVVA